MRFKGIPVTLGDKIFVVPPLNFKSLKELQERLVAYSGRIDPASIQLVADATKAALLRNYTEEDLADLEELIDLSNMEELMQAVMDVSGLKRKEWEASQSAQQDGGDPSTGTTSTGS